jgi:WD40 repeat protein
MWDTKGDLLKVMKDHKDCVNVAKWNKDCNLIATAGFDKRIFVSLNLINSCGIKRENF